VPTNQQDILCIELRIARLSCYVAALCYAARKDGSGDHHLEDAIDLLDRRRWDPFASAPVEPS
jgi:hypothetical protein